jgi:hypothetical protein
MKSSSKSDYLVGLPLLLLTVAGVVVGQRIEAVYILLGMGIIGFSLLTRQIMLPVLGLLLIIPATSYNITPYLYGQINENTGALVIAGIPFNGLLVLYLGFPVLFFIRYIIKKETLGLHSFIVSSWIIALLISLAISIKEFSLGYQGWSLPIRQALAFGGFFYGLVWGHFYSARLNSLTPYFLTVSLGLGLLAVFGSFHHRVLWYLTAFAPALSLLSFRESNVALKLIGASNILILFAYSILGLNFRETGDSTFSLQILFLGSVFISFVMLFSRKGTSAALRKFAGWPLQMLCYGFTATAIMLAGEFTFRGEHRYSLVAEFLYKLFDDRANLWRNAWNEIVVSGGLLPDHRPIFRYHILRGFEYVGHGAHNSYLQLLWRNGWLAGLLLILITGWMCQRMARHTLPGNHSLQAAFLIGGLLTYSVGYSTGHYPVYTELGPLTFFFAGIACGSISEKLNYG